MLYSLLCALNRKVMVNKMNELKFYWNGIKGSTNKLQKCFYTFEFDTTDIIICGCGYSRFDKDIRAHFTVTNTTDWMSDYFDVDGIIVSDTHPLYLQVVTAALKQQERELKKYIKRGAKISVPGSLGNLEKSITALNAILEGSN